jgi:hypothetical protein
MNPKRIKTSVKIPSDVKDIRIFYDKLFHEYKPYIWNTYVYLYDVVLPNVPWDQIETMYVGVGKSECNTELDTPNKFVGREKALGRAVADYYRRQKANRIHHVEEKI